MPSLRRNMVTAKVAKARRTAMPERTTGRDCLRKTAAPAKTKKPIGSVKYEVAAPRMVGCTRAMEIAAPPMSPRKPNKRSRQVARLAASHQIKIRRQHKIGPKMEIIQ